VVIAVREERPGDAPAIRLVHEAAFPTLAEAALVAALRAAGRLAVSLVALEADAVVGHVACSPLAVPGGLGLAPLGVVPARQRRGIGAELVRAGPDAGRAGGAAFAVVLGEPAYYARFGFAPASRWGLLDECGGGDAFQALPLVPEGVPAGVGLVRYAPEFAAIGDRPS
jgi:putative acetyltransferase